MSFVECDGMPVDVVELVVEGLTWRARFAEALRGIAADEAVTLRVETSSGEGRAVTLRVNLPDGVVFLCEPLTAAGPALAVAALSMTIARAADRYEAGEAAGVALFRAMEPGKATDITERRGIEARTCARVVAWAERVGLPGVRCRAELWGEYGFSPRYTEFRRVQVWVNYSFSSLATLDVRCLPSEVEATVEEFLTRLPTIVAASIREAVERHRANVAEILANAEKREREAAKDRARHAEIIAKCAPEWAEDLARADRVEASTV